jgi:DNA-directed RNA polymerase specialized sigma24 family protein
MAHAPRILPSPEDELHLHRRLLDGELDATADLAAQYLDPLIADLKRRNDPRIPDAVFGEAAEDALLSLMKDPTTFVPARSRATRPLFAYLCLSARRDLLNILAREKRQLEGQISLDSVQHSPDGWKCLGEDDDPSLTLQRQEELAQGDKTIVAPARNGLPADEQEAMELIVQGERKTAAFARVLRIEHLPKEEQQRKVNRLKNKLRKRIKRGRESHGQ